MTTGEVNTEGRRRSVPEPDRSLRVLMVEDSAGDAALVVWHLREHGFVPAMRRVETGEEFRAALAEPWDAVIADYNVPGFGALDALRLYREAGVDIPFIIVSGTIDDDTAVAAMRAGAHDYVLKDNLRRLVPGLEREIRDAAERQARRDAERDLRHARKMDALGRLAGGIAHDFNNLLTAILGNAEFLLDGMAEDDPLRDEARVIRSAAERAASLTRQLLAFGRRKADEPQRVDLNELVTNLWQLLTPLVSESIELEWVPGPRLGLVLVDPGQVEQVLINLVVNAQDAMPEGGRLTVATVDSPAGREGDAWVSLVVRDTGVGMDAPTRARIFEPFFTTKEPGRGTGLGLANVADIVTASGGTVRVESEPGRGTRVEILLPRVGDGPRPPSARAAAAALPHGTEEVLVVEDSEIVRTVVARTLRACGYAVREAGDPAEALARYGSAPGALHLLLTDVVMPGMSGPALAARLQALHPSLKVLFMSGYADDTVTRQGLLPHGAHYLPKPILPETLATRVRVVLDQR